ncbi:NAD-dependent epimerase/dehydratase family protein [Thermophilibacter provencensis]
MLGTVLVTGAAGFIGSFLCRRLVEDGGCEVTGLDNVNSYYDPRH